MELKIRQRQGVNVFVKRLKQSKQLRRFGDIQYVSRRMHYVVIYMDRDKVAENVAKLRQLNFVKKILVSPRPELNMDFFQAMGVYKLTEEDQEKLKNKSERK